MIEEAVILDALRKAEGYLHDTADLIRRTTHDKYWEIRADLCDDAVRAIQVCTDSIESDSEIVTMDSEEEDWIFIVTDASREFVGKRCQCKVEAGFLAADMYYRIIQDELKN